MTLKELAPLSGVPPLTEGVPESRRRLPASKCLSTQSLNFSVAQIDFLLQGAGKVIDWPTLTGTKGNLAVQPQIP
jgi:hypothetical protein